MYKKNNKNYFIGERSKAVARALLTGDVSEARAIVGAKKSWELAEANEISIAVREANNRFNCSLNVCDFV